MNGCTVVLVIVELLLLMFRYLILQEVEIGLAADVGTLQRLPKIVGNESLVRELSFTARKLRADEAKEFGLVR